jgi:Niemann-Pick C1 protein
MVMFYTIIFLGSCSPVHMRSCVALFGLMCTGLAYILGYSICGTFGEQTAGIHGLMPFLLLGIGVDDMFVICNALD